MSENGDLNRLGWFIWRNDPQILAWADAARPAATAALNSPDNAHWYRSQQTWFVGVDCLPNDVEGRVLDGPPLPLNGLPKLPLHAGQVSAVFPGYPQPLEGECPAAAAYRLRRDAAHVDGLLPIGPDRHRMLREPHSWIMGLPLTWSDAMSSPLVVWDGSHEIMRAAFQQALSGVAEDDIQNVDLTEAYQSARKEVFQTCQRRTLPANPGDAIALHRLALHGIAPWQSAKKDPRVTVYFRPQGRYSDWITAP